MGESKDKKNNNTRKYLIKKKKQKRAERPLVRGLTVYSLEHVLRVKKRTKEREGWKRRGEVENMQGSNK